MAESLFGAIPFIGGNVNWANVGYIATWTGVMILIAGVFFALFFLMLRSKRSMRTIELDQNTKRVRMFTGRIKKDGRKVEKYYAGKLRKWLARPQQKDLYIKGSKDLMFLMKDNNGLHHPLRLPTWKELVKFYNAVYNVDLTKVNPHPTQLHDVFFLPNPSEDLDWVTSQLKEADNEFKDTKWWQHPTVMILGAGVISFMIIVVTLIFR